MRRKDLIKELGGRCALCGSVINLEIHHIDKNPENNELDNLELYCKDCHKHEIHNWGRANTIDILRAISETPRITMQELDELLDSSYQNISNTIFFLRQLDLVENVARGVYVITYAGEKTLERLEAHRLTAEKEEKT